MSWNIDQPVVAETAAVKANKDGTDFTNPSTWLSRLDAPTNLEARRRGLPNVSAAVFDGVTSGTRITAPCQDVGTGDFSMWVRVRVPTSVPSNSSVYAAVSGSATSAFSSAGAFLITQEANGNIAVGGYVATVFTLVITVSGFISTYGGQIVDLVLTRATVSGTSTLTLYVNGVSVGSSTAAAASTSANSIYFHAGANAGIQPSHTLHRAAFYNRALSLADVAELITNGVNQADMWGTTTPAYSSDFSAGSDSWSLVRSTVTGNVDSILGVNDTLRVVVDSSATATHYTFRPTGLTAGKRFRLSLDYYVPSGQASVTGIRVLHNTGSVSTQIAIGNTPGSWQTIANQEFISSATRIDINAWNGTSDTFTGNGTDLFYIKNVVAVRIGAVINLDLTPGVGLFFPDMSSNLLHADGFGGINHTMPREYGQMTVVKDLLHSDISSTAGTTLLFQLPPNCGIVHVEYDRLTAFDSGTTLEVGTAGSSTRYAALLGSSTGILGAASSSLSSESNSALTPIYVRKSGATTVGRVRVRVTYSIRG